MSCPALLRGVRCPRHLLSPIRSSQLLPPRDPRRALSYVQGQSPEPRVREYFYYIDHQGQLFLDDMKVKNFITCFKGGAAKMMRVPKNHIMEAQNLTTSLGNGQKRENCLLSPGFQETYLEFVSLPDIPGRVDKQFLVFFFKQVQRNKSGRYEEHFPYMSPCGMERNYIRCDDRPLVFTHLLCDESSGVQRLSYCGGGDKLVVRFEPEKLVMLPDNGRVYHPAPEKSGGVGLVKSSLAFELSPCFQVVSGSNAGSPTFFHWKGKRYALTNELLPLI